MQRQNMRLNSSNMSLSDAKEKLEKMQKLLPEIEIISASTDSYISSDLQASSKLKVRLYIQSQSKITFLESTGTGWEKIADAKFPNDPFPLLIHFFNHLEQYEKELREVLEERRKFEKKQKIAGEIIKSLLMKKFRETKTIWHLEPNQEDFTLTIENGTDKKIIPISFENFTADIKNLIF